MMIAIASTVPGRLGSAVAASDLDGDGVLETYAGAPNIAEVSGYTGPPLMRSASGLQTRALRRPCRPKICTRLCATQSNPCSGPNRSKTLSQLQAGLGSSSSSGTREQ